MTYLFALHQKFCVVKTATPRQSALEGRATLSVAKCVRSLHVRGYLTSEAISLRSRGGSLHSETPLRVRFPYLRFLVVLNNVFECTTYLFISKILLSARKLSLEARASHSQLWQPSRGLSAWYFIHYVPSNSTKSSILGQYFCYFAVCMRPNLTTATHSNNVYILRWCFAANVLAP